MAFSKKSASVEDLAKEVAALKKEVAALKKELKAKSSGGADPRLDQLWKALQNKPHFWLSKKLFVGE
jgi:ribosomal protein L29